MPKYDYDLFVIGAGSGGVRAGRMAAQLGKRVAVAEESKPGGTCVVRGCVPKKYLVYGAEYGAAIKSAKNYGWSASSVKFNWATLRDNIQTEVSRLSGIYANILEKNGAKLFNQRAELVDKHTVRLTDTGQEVTAHTILIAVGGRPFMPEIKGIEHAIMSDDAFLLNRLPEKAVIIGGGYIASEFAGIFAGLGVKTTQSYRGDKLLRGFDEDVRDLVTNQQRLLGIEVKLNASPTEIKKSSGGLIVSFDDGSKIGTECVFMATGRKPYTATLGLENAGVKTADSGAIKVNEFSQSSAKNIYAVGDVTDRVNLTPVAIREAMAFIDTVYKDKPRGYDHNDIASAVFTRPPVGVVGLTEMQAREKYGDKFKVYTTSFRPMKNIIAGKDERCFMKLITQGRKETVIGIHLVGDDTPEIIQALGITVKGGLTKADFDATCAVHPTLAEEIVTL
ncbi:MAG: glutathione-disulfide reductase [Hellea sp.]|nr:glutathione-disulfide reductase [Hellea sp.]